MDTEGFEPSTSRMRNGRSSTELSALREDVKRTPARIRTRVARFKVWSANHYTTGAMLAAHGVAGADSRKMSSPAHGQEPDALLCGIVERNWRPVDAGT